MKNNILIQILLAVGAAITLTGFFVFPASTDFPMSYYDTIRLAQGVGAMMGGLTSADQLRLYNLYLIPVSAFCGLISAFTIYRTKWLRFLFLAGIALGLIPLGWWLFSGSKPYTAFWIAAAGIGFMLIIQLLGMYWAAGSGEEEIAEPMTIKSQLEAAKALIDAKNYKAARSLLGTINHPKAQEWLARMDERGMI